MSARHHRFEALVGALMPDLYRYARWLCHDPALAEDLVQETMLRAWRSLDSLRDEHSAKSWLITILRRELARHLSRQRGEEVDVDSLQLAAVGGTGDAADTDRHDLRRAIATLEPDYREPLVLQVIMGFSVAEIAETMELTPGAVLTRLHRARNKLRERVGEAAQIGEASA
jgi:RNA polymerase sigma-70 factor (ECF subfamily)